MSREIRSIRDIEESRDREAVVSALGGLAMGHLCDADSSAYEMAFMARELCADGCFNEEAAEIYIVNEINFRAKILGRLAKSREVALACC